MTIIVVTSDGVERKFDADRWEGFAARLDIIDGDRAVAEFAEGAWLCVYRERERPWANANPKPRVAKIEWRTGLNEFPMGTPVWDRQQWLAGAEPSWEGEGPDSSDDYSQWGPFTSTPPRKGVAPQPHHNIGEK